MKNVSLYIAKRYNTHTLLISMVLILLTSCLFATLIYVGSSSIELIRNLIFPKQSITSSKEILVYVIMLLYLVAQTIGVYGLFNKILGKFSKKRKVITAFSLMIFSLLTGSLLFYFKLTEVLIWNCVLLILISTGLLSFLYALLILLFSKRKITGVSIITSIAVLAITIATCALFIILSVFSGLEKMNIQFFSNVNPDLRISPEKGKLIPDINKVTKILDQNNWVKDYSKVIEEKVSVEFGDKQDIAYIKGLDKNYTNVVKIDTTLVGGRYFDYQNQNEFIASEGVARRLQMYVDNQNAARLRMPKPGKGLISSEKEAFNTAIATPVGVSFINDQFDKYIFSPISLTRSLLDLPENAAYSIEIKLRPGINVNSAKITLQKQLGDAVLVQTRQDLDATFLKVMNVENLIIYLIFTLVIVIASFNLAGAIIIIIIDKKHQIKSMWSFGMPQSQIKSIFFKTGLLITSFSVLFGLFLGILIGFLQINFHLVMANPVVPFPFEFTVSNILVVISTVFSIGSGISYLVSRRLPS